MIVEKRNHIRQSVFNRDFATNDWGMIPVKKERIDPFLSLAILCEVFVIAMVFAGFVSS
jgi:hypothetical protein